MSKENKDTFSGTMQPLKTGKVSKKNDDIKVMFKERRKFDLHIGRDVITFKGRETKSIPKEWLNHRDWKQICHLFVVKGV